MSKYVLIPDSFKGTLSSSEVCALMAEGVRRADPQAETVAIPVADGGEGTVEAFLLAMDGERVTLTVRGPYGEPVEGFYGRLTGGAAVVEMAAAAGLPMVGERRNPELTSTYGVGELIAHALDHGAREIILGLGGSCTNDGGCGMACALGARFYDESGAAFVPVGGTLGRIARVDLDGLHPRLKDAPLRVMCDIDNPLCGENGAAAVFGPQKGADAAMVARLDEGLARLAEIVRRDTGRDMLTIPGAGAAGGMGGGAAALLGGRLQMGIDAVLDATGFDQQITDADAVLTGEGRLDGQSLRGKAVIGVARRARAQGKPVFAFAGCVEKDARASYAEGVTAMFSINRAPLAFEEAIKHSPENLSAVVEDAIRCFRAGRR